MKQLTNNELTATARRLLIENNFAPEFSPDVTDAAQLLETRQSDSTENLRDLRALLWSSIDDKSSLDLDQIEYAERLPNGDIKLLVGIADVDALVPKNSAIDKFAYKNTVSIYAAHRVFPMLPERLSTDLTSLREGVERLAVVVEMNVRADGDVQTSDVYRALVYNRAKLSYEGIGAWLDENAPIPEKVASVAGMEAQVLLQKETAARLYQLRRKKGALEFETIETSPVVENGVITGINSERQNSARRIIENFMIAANVEMAEFLENRHSLSLRRVVKTPARWNRIVEVAKSFGTDLPQIPDAPALSEFLTRRRAADPVHFPDLSLSIIKLLGAGEYVVQTPDAPESDGHFGLAVQDYAHSTAPNRRYADLIVQRLVKATLAGKPSPYTFNELTEIAAHCNERESAARKVERQIRKVVAASVMSSRIGEIFDAIVTGITPSGTFARTLHPPVDGRIVSGEYGLQVGEKVRVKLISTDAEKGFIDFACRN
ncbi:MAG: RNB domain-containing ribonuclease [Acidobacteriota bacterium]|nr:RNB domain-containing ribonuclease [Acidobacteriota bacterium]